MKQRVITTIVLLTILLLGITAQERKFNHPGSILTKTDLERIKLHINQKDEPWLKSWNELQSSSWGNLSRTANPSTEIGGSDGTRQRAATDAVTAMIDAIQWHITGQARYADHAVKLLSAWGNKVETANAQLFQFPAVSMSMAAEMLRNEDGSFYEGWKETDLNNFLNMVRNILYPACQSQAKNNTMTSWSAPAMMAVLASGLLLDDEDIYEEGLAYFRTPSIPGSVYNSIGENGQVNEMGRDNVHAMLTLGALSQMAQLAWCQGDDLWGEDDNRLLRGFEYWCTYNLGHEELSYEPQKASDGSSNWYYISTHDNGFRLTPDGRCFECVYHHYKELKNLDMSTLYPSVTAYANLTRPEIAPDFGTLFYTIDAANSPLISEVPAPAEELKAEGGVSSVWLSWKDTRRDDASGFKVLRSIDGEQFSTIANLNNYTRKSYRDITVEPGRIYYYKILLYNSAGDSAPGDVVSVYVPDTGGLPDGWKTANIGNGKATGYHTNSLGESFIVEGSGNGFRRNDEGHGFVYHRLKGDCSLTVRVVSTEQTFNAVGIMLRGSLNSGSAQVGITLGGVGLRYCDVVSRTASGNQTTWKTGCDFTFAPVWLRIEREGRIVRTYQSRDGETWHLIQQLSVTLPTTAYIGMLVASGTTYQACFDHVSLIAATEQDAESTIPSDLKATCQSDATAHLVWRGIYGAEKYIIYRDGTPIGEAMTNSYNESNLSETTYSYTVSAVVGGEEGEQSEAATVEMVSIEKLTGIVIGTSGSWNNNSATTRKAVFDDNLSTYFDAAQSNGAWAGIDLGANSETVVTEIRYCPRTGFSNRMNGGCFQGANSRAFTDAVTLYTINGNPAETTLNAVTINTPTAFRYLRYIGPDGGSCNVAEVQFYGYKAVTNGIEEVKDESLRIKSEMIYDLSGRCVNGFQLSKGVYIVNGKKYILK